MQQEKATNRASGQQDNVTLLILGPLTQHTPLAWLFGVTAVLTGQSQHYCSCRGAGVNPETRRK